MKYIIICIFLLIPFCCFAQKVTRINENCIRIEGDTMLYRDVFGKPISQKAHADSLRTGKYIITIKGTDKNPEIHLTYKYPKLESLKGMKIPNSIYTDFNGKSICLKGHTAVIFFWDTSCSVCIKELTALDYLSEYYPNIRFLALTHNTKQEVSNLIKKLHLKWGNIQVLPEDNGELTQIIKIFTYPSSIVINSDLEIEGAFAGGNPRKLLKLLESLE